MSEADTDINRLLWHTSQIRFLYIYKKFHRTIGSYIDFVVSVVECDKANRLIFHLVISKMRKVDYFIFSVQKFL